MKFLVTGGAGLIGSYLCQTLLNQGHVVICIDNLLTSSKKNIEHLLDNKRFAFLQGDASEGVRINVDGIYHLASPTAPDDSTKYGKLTEEVNSIVTENLLSTGKKVLYVSSMKVYGDCSRMTSYIKGKREGERLCSLYRFAKVARLSSVYGPRMRKEDSRVIPTFINRAMENKTLSVWNGGEQIDYFCYVTEIVDGLIQFMDSPTFDLIEFGHPVGIKIIDLAKMIIRLTGSKSEIITNENKVVVPECHLAADLTYAKKNFRWYPRIDIETGIKKILEENKWDYLHQKI